ncbi:hypothetical protein FZI85_16145 [Mycobacterium sp. CBMA293]|uniref:hypothetical protein n=1 Tax=unclassified Mycolicibacterium TaxID=2636767 RepID=UPI0012DC7C49|nr:MULTISPECIES: hypothetical protein [unclassified Mycolicibacterium]MUL46936.1 hypothetical protein [Mycolicibacterium sp. CBMA 360]MUL57277.1 hypothetical protein [Mycolicibacterium sp. CBMA 335]MUL70317.1 hypothetical protein [Mycolicibacterium sp. CBMA 311]MUL92365.1 hypothetical protein [Mycolicibacterium sp. CBMA 230]MUM06786.1 hypothetical protein [Mycolicibacterium sp. CBMA 213]
MKATAAAHAATARRFKLNMQNLSTFLVATGKVEAEADWLANKIEVLQEQSAKRRDEQRRRAGAALLEMSERGERVRDIARLTQISESQVRELIRLAESRSASAGQAPDAATGQGPSSVR